MKSFIHSMTLLQAHNSHKFALGLENGIVKTYSFDEKSRDISPYLDIKEHEKALTFIYGLRNGNLVTCSTDKLLKIISIPKSFFKNYVVVQILQCAPDSFYYQTVIEMNETNLIAGDWKNIVISKQNKKETNSQEHGYIELNRIAINNRITALLQVDDGVFVSAHYGIATTLKILKFLI